MGPCCSIGGTPNIQIKLAQSSLALNLLELGRKGETSDEASAFFRFGMIVISPLTCRYEYIDCTYISGTT